MIIHLHLNKKTNSKVTEWDAHLNYGLLVLIDDFLM